MQFYKERPILTNLTECNHILTDYERICDKYYIIAIASHLLNACVFPAPITFDPNTAQSNLSLSEELTSVQYGSKQVAPDNPERCVNRVCVLGTPGFSSGRHRWTVDVGQGRDWYIGVARESIQRKNTVFLDPGEGFWVIGRTNGDSYWAQTPNRTKLVVKQKPERITVELDYAKSKVVFINNTDGSVMHTFKDKFTERIFPYFSPGLYEEGKISSPITICAHTITLKMD